MDDNCITNYADDTTPYAINKNVDGLIDRLQSDSHTLLEWFNINFFKLNADKCKLLISNQEDNLSVDIEGEIITCQSTVKLLGIIIDNKLNFNEHISNICKKVSLKLHVLARVSHLMDHEKLRLLMKAFIESQFSYCSLIWMFHSRKLNNRINKLHERALRLVYKDLSSSFEELLDRDKSFSMHDRNLQKLAIEMYKVKNNLSPSFMHSLFPKVDKPYNLRSNPSFKTRNIRTTYYGAETLMHRGPKTWDMLPVEMKKSTNLMEFKRKIKEWKPIGCSCRMCIPFVANLGFI